jgi:hypothetical protein
MLIRRTQVAFVPSCGGCDDVRHAKLGGCVAGCACVPALAGQIGPPQSPIDVEVGARYWYSWGHDRFNLFDQTGAFQVSRLTWQNMRGSSLEGFFRANTKMGLFVKGYLGGGWLNNGSLQDEDFPPFISPYSSTDSSAKGNLKYGSIDLGYNFVNSAATKIGPFVGYHYWQDSNQASGCTQTAGNPFICAPAIDGSVGVIDETYTWKALRLGVAGDWRFGDKWRLQGDVAYARGNVDMSDLHLLRQNMPGGFAGSTPTDATANGIQLDATVSYQVTDHFSLGVGGRYWKYFPNGGTTHFEQSAIPIGFFLPQASNLEAERYGITVEGAYHF